MNLYFHLSGEKSKAKDFYIEYWWDYSFLTQWENALSEVSNLNLIAVDYTKLAFVLDLV